jgi:hypothetical protein
MTSTQPPKNQIIQILKAFFVISLIAKLFFFLFIDRSIAYYSIAFDIGVILTMVLFIIPPIWSDADEDEDKDYKKNN